MVLTKKRSKRGSFDFGRFFRFSFYLLKNKEIKKKSAEMIIIKGPAGSERSFESKIPKKAEKAPKKVLKKLY